MIEKLIERLRREVPSGRYTIGSAGISSDGKLTHSVPSLPIMVLANPDGPEAAQALRELKASADAMAEALKPSVGICGSVKCIYCERTAQALATYQEKFGHDG